MESDFENAKAASDFNTRSPSIGAVLREIVDSFQGVIRSEIRLATVEMKDTVRHVSKHAQFAALFGVIALLGVLPFIAFLVIGLGRVLEDNYWLSSLIVAVVMIGIGAALAYKFAKQIGSDNLGLARTRRTLSEDKEMVSRKVQQISELTKRRVS